LKLIDLNLLIYAVNRDAPNHERARDWLEDALSGAETVALPWIVILGFLRVTTHPRVLARPISAEQALEVVDGWLSRGNIVTLPAGDDHWPLLRSLLSVAGTAGNLTTDAHLAALAIEAGCELCSTDNDFGRFQNLRWINPVAG
jgi:toxin-antitoxin system PIN domain toxin